MHQTHKRFKNLRCKHAAMITFSTRELAKAPDDKSALWLAAAYYLKKFSIIGGKAYRLILEKNRGVYCTAELQIFSLSERTGLFSEKLAGAGEEMNRRDPKNEDLEKRIMDLFSSTLTILPKFPDLKFRIEEVMIRSSKPRSSKRINTEGGLSSEQR